MKNLRHRRSLTSALIASALGLTAMLLLASLGGKSASAAVSDVDFSIGVDPSITGAALPCDSSGTPTTTCLVAAGQDFLVRVRLNQLPSSLPNGSYYGFDLSLSYSGVSSDGTVGSVDMTPWPGCVGPAVNVTSGQVAAACTVLLGPDSTYTGLMATVRLTCTADGTVTLVSGDGNTDIADHNLSFYSEASGESLTIHCVAPLAYPGDTDGDGCPDQRELGMNQMMGGQRNFLNPWDYFNPSGDGKNRVDDILMVVQHFGLNQGDPMYDTKYDRTHLGPNAWNLGPPDGKIRVADILAQVYQYGHDCS